MLELHTADRAERLVDHLVDVLTVPPADPFEPEWVAVPSIGMRRWLAQQLSRRLGAGPGATDGISANIHLPFPAELRQLVLDEVLPGEVPQLDGADRWQVDRLVWTVLEVLHDAGDDPLLAPLVAVPTGATLLGRASRLADLLDRYAVHRPGLITAWAEGHDRAPAGEKLTGEQLWQPHLFRVVRDRVGQPSPPERLPALLAAIADGSLTLSPKLPDRIALFGLTTMPPDLGPLLEALAVRREVRVLTLSLSPELTRATLGTASAMAPAGVDDRDRAWSFPRRSDPTVDVARHPLLRSWAQPNRELAAQLGVAGKAVSGLDRPPGPSLASGRSLLARVHDDIRANVAPDGGHVLASDDRSIQVHACSGSTRQVEALRDAICGLLAADPTLTEGDIAVLSPTLEQFVPFIESVFGPSASAESPPYRPDGPPSLRYRITDRSLRDRNPVLGALDAVLGLVAGRCTASAVTELVSLEPVRRRFGLVADDLSLLDRWIGDTHIRWGLDGAHRVPWGLPADFSANTWQAGLDQLLMGVAISESAGMLGPGEVAPVLVEGSDVVVAGRIAHAVRTIGAVADALSAPRAIADWCDDLGEAADLLFGVPFDGAWQRRRLDAVLDGLRRQATPPGGEPPTMLLTLADVRRTLRDHLEGEPARAAFGSGTITVCSLLPLHSVPHRVICVLGLDQDALPRGGLDGDDLLGLQPDVGDREPRAESRQLLLEAVLSARDAVVITYTGTDIRTNQPAPPAVALDELWDCLAATCGLTPTEVIARLRVDQPRQAFAPSNFEAPPRSFDPVALAGARAFLQRPSMLADPAPLVTGGLTAVDVGAIDLADLRQFLRHPVRTFFQRRLELRLPRDEPGASDTLAVKLDPLEGWALGEGLLDLERHGLDPAHWLRVEQARGALPAAALGEVATSPVAAEVEAILGAARARGYELDPRDHHPVDVSVAGLRIVGSVGPCADGPRPGPVTFTYSRGKPSHRLALWLDLLVLTLSDPTVAWRAVGLSRSEKRGSPLVHDLQVAGADPAERRATAEQALTVVVELHRAGMQEPLPLFDRTSELLHRGQKRRAADIWQGGMFPESADDHYRLAFGERSFTQLERLEVAGRTTAQWASLLWDAVDRSLSPDTPVDPADAAVEVDA